MIPMATQTVPPFGYRAMHYEVSLSAMQTEVFSLIERCSAAMPEGDNELNQFAVHFSSFIRSVLESKDLAPQTAEFSAFR